MNVADIKANPAALAAATAKDWSACAAAMQAVSVTAEPRLCFSVETSLAILAVGGDPNQIMTAMDKDATGKFLLTMLATVGVMWAHPLTAAYLDAAVAANVLVQASRDAVVHLSQPTTYPHVDVTADDCQRAWLIDECLTPIFAVHTAAAIKLSNAQASLEPEHTDGLSISELQARCDAITASATGEV